MTGNINGTLTHRGITCSSFTSVSLKPPIISFSVGNPSSSLGLLYESKKFAVNILSKRQIQQSIHFSYPNTQSDFTSFPHSVQDGLVILKDCVGVLFCNLNNCLTVGDHDVLFGDVIRIYNTAELNGYKGDALLYYQSSYHGIGDELFKDAFEQATLSFDEWTHMAHLRMGWIYLRESQDDMIAYTRAKQALILF